MNENQRARRKSSGRYRRSTKKRAVFRPPQHPGRLIAIALIAVTVVSGALVWGNVLKERSDAYRADQEAGRWTLPPTPESNRPTIVPEVQLLEIKPEGNVGDILINNSHDGVLLPLRDSSGRLNYLSNTATEAGIPVSDGAPELSADVARVRRRGLHVSGVFYVSCFSESTVSLQTYHRGLELALLCEYALAGMNDLLLLGLPSGDDTADAMTIAFLNELDTLLSTLENPPAVGVALPLTSLEGEPDESGTPVYAGEMTPGRIALACDYLALDLRDQSAEDMDALLPRLSYAYMRHELRLLTDESNGAIAKDLFSHGFRRIFEMKIS